MNKITRNLTVCVITVFLSFAGVFASFADASPIDPATAAGIVESLIGEIVYCNDEELSTNIEMYESSGYTGIADGFRSYQEIKGYAGDYQSLGNPVTTVSADGSTVITTPVIFTNKTVDLEFVIGADGYISGFSFKTAGEDSSSLGAKMKEAGVNLVVGMGTVFLVLIFLCWIISLFKNVNTLEKKIREKKLAKAAGSKAQDAAENREVLELVPETAGTDDEIQAVIAAAIAAYEAESGCSIEKQPALENGITIKTYRRK